MRKKHSFIYCFMVALLTVITPQTSHSEKQMDYFDEKVLLWAQECAQLATAQFEKAVNNGALSIGQVFDTFYIPIPGTEPQKYKTQYDQFSDEAIRPIIDNCLKKDSRLTFTVLVDKNGYLPTHNTKYSQPLTGDLEKDAKWNRTKRIFNDTTGLAAASNTEPFIFQQYSRDTGEEIRDISVPIYINGQHWGAIRVGYK